MTRDKHGSLQESVPVIRGLITEENLTPRWRGAHTLYWAVPWQVCMEGRGDGPQGRGLSGASSWRVAEGPRKRRRTWKVQGRA